MARLGGVRLEGAANRAASRFSRRLDPLESGSAGRIARPTVQGLRSLMGYEFEDWLIIGYWGHWLRGAA